MKSNFQGSSKGSTSHRGVCYLSVSVNDWAAQLPSGRPCSAWQGTGAALSSGSEVQAERGLSGLGSNINEMQTLLWILQSSVWGSNMNLNLIKTQIYVHCASGKKGRMTFSSNTILGPITQIWLSEEPELSCVFRLNGTQWWPPSASC